MPFSETSFPFLCVRGRRRAVTVRGQAASPSHFDTVCTTLFFFDENSWFCALWRRLSAACVVVGGARVHHVQPRETVAAQSHPRECRRVQGERAAQGNAAPRGLRRGGSSKK